ncbi:MAG: DUF1343 domain-containing protein [Bacteroidales bacterium]|nr:DUF1343 domain-containing protein [Bacteroidales bacterium]
MKRLIKFRKIPFIALLLLVSSCRATPRQDANPKMLVTGAERTEIYLPMLKGKNIGLVANHTSLIGTTHLLDSLLALEVNIIKVFSPEHGFRGDADAGAQVSGGIDPKTGVAVVSLYGQKKKPTQEDLLGLELVIFDIQDVGARFYTYISTMTLVMEACAEKSIPLMVLDRPNPNGFYVDGPVLEPEYTTFVGLHPVPVVHGMTVAEYAQMVNGEGWLEAGLSCELKVVPMLNYDHQTLYELPVKPSPNLQDMTSVYLYPSLCFFEGTMMSVGRGTGKPFRIIGHPDYTEGDFKFIPVATPGAALNPPFKDQECVGFDFSDMAYSIILHQRLSLQPLINAYRFFKNEKSFFNNYFNTLAGTATLRAQIEAGLSEAEIRESWQEDLAEFRKTRKKYLLYDD